LRNVPGEGATARTVEIKNILQKSDGTYQVRWTETTYSNGIRRSKEDFTGLFQVKLIPARDEADTFKNPIGVYITNFTWSREFAGTVQRDDTASPQPVSPTVPSQPGAMQ
jgi:type IV secretion system protein VirB5